MKLYTVTKEYLNKIHDKDPKSVVSRSMIGFVTCINGFIYFVPVEHVNDNDYERDGSIKRSTPAILRMIERKTNQCIGKCLFSNMFPVPYKEIASVEIDLLLEKQKEFIQQRCGSTSKRSGTMIRLI